MPDEKSLREAQAGLSPARCTALPLPAHRAFPEKWMDEK
ncbi:hypothetical protein ABI_13490 [Asticcacaulis biprosthecium C19]|uniref:Uncharacterized protein n=1 Tax=Asticcacaulis biprosthecium C19 TaxID=715226 RepID=F4QI44_9CAUL|nr:hypothetical protein ABI_13490 [Asticcacaulis biprosthecium C19]